MNKGFFVVIDGVDGAGKTTQMALLCTALRARGLRVHETCEPSQWPIGQLIRRYLRHELQDGIPGWASMALLFAADRMQHVEHEILPHLKNDEIVVCDRYDASSIAYQTAMACQLNEPSEPILKWVASINDYALRPDLTIFLDLAPEVAAQRRMQRGAPAELFEQLSLQKKIRDQYQKLHQVRPHDRNVWIDASASLEHVHQTLMNEFQNAYS